EALAVRRKVFGDESPEARAAWMSLADTLEQSSQENMNRADFGPAREALREILQITTRLYGEDHYRTVYARNDLGMCETLAGFDRAKVERFGLGTRKSLEVTEFLNDRNLTMSKEKLASARTSASEALEIFKELLGANHW